MRTDVPDIGSLTAQKADGSRLAIHVADVSGRFVRARRWVFYGLIAFYMALPIVHIGGHPAVHLDIGARRFYLFGSTFNAQDVWIAIFILTTIGFALLFVTAWLGRAWCGWACPQTVFLDGVYRRIERWVEGSRERRLKAAEGPWTARRVARAAVKHGLYIGFSLLLAHVTVSLFVSAKDLGAMIREGPIGHEVPFAWSMGFTGLLYFNYAWFREQTCVIVCPYGRLQSVMTDRDSLIVGYDVRRGEPRGRMIKGAEKTLGDCVDCRKCVTACPTGIDIRNGLQLECVACAQCVDACDAVMDKIQRPRGLIRFDSLNGLAGQPTRLLRPRLYAYAGLLAASAIALVVSLVGRTPFEANLLRARGMPYLVEASTVRNQFELHLVNKHPGTSTFEIRVQGDRPVDVVVARDLVELASLADLRIPIFISIAKNDFQDAFPVRVQVVDRQSGATKELEASFLGPKG